MTVPEVTGRPQPRWRSAVKWVLSLCIALSGLQLIFMVPFSLLGGSMDLQMGTSAGIVIKGTFTYPYHNALKGRTVDIPVTATTYFTDPSQAVVDFSGGFAVEDQSDFGPFGDAGHGSVTLPKEVRLDHETNATDLLQPLRTGSRHQLEVIAPVDWRGRLLVGLPSALIWAGLGVAPLMCGTFLLSIFDGQPFHPKNPRRLLWLGGSLGVIVFADSWLRAWIARAILDVLNQHGHQIPLQVSNPGINLAPIYVIIGVLCLSAAFRAGTRMAADTDGLV